MADRDPVEAYAIELVLSGMAHTVQDDLNESGDLTDEEWDDALELAKDIVRVIEDRADELLLAAHRRGDDRRAAVAGPVR